MTTTLSTTVTDLLAAVDRHPADRQKEIIGQYCRV